MKEILLDAAKHNQIYFQDAATPIMEGLIKFHNEVTYILILIIMFILWIIAYYFVYFMKPYHVKIAPLTHKPIVEAIWTITPALILATLAIPSFALLYSMDETIDPLITIKIIGHQWYWSYEYMNKEFDSYMVNEADLNIGELRLLEVDNPLELPTFTHIRLIITSDDVLHSWTIPSFGVKLDAVPGRLNQSAVFIKREGKFFGQCSEICGVNHGFMPIVIRAFDPLLWYVLNLD